MPVRTKFLNSTSMGAMIMVSAICGNLSIAFAEDKTAADKSIAIEEIKITATRRGETTLLKTPVAVTAMDTGIIEKYNPRDLNDLTAMVPSLSAGNTSAFRSASFAMRGVSEDTIILYKESPVGVTLDDFVIPHAQTSNLEVFDIEQIEVLRGPQGTLFGKNTTGGVINVRTKRPVLNETGADLRFEGGSFGTYKGTAAVNLPLVDDKLAFRFAGMYLKSDGYVKNGYSYQNAVDGSSTTGDGRRIGGDDVFSGRAKLLWQASDDVTALFQYEGIRDRGESPVVINDTVPGYVFDFWGYGAGSQSDPLDRGGYNERDDLPFNIKDGHRVDVNGYYLNLEVSINDELTLYSVTGYRDQKSRLVNSYSGTVGPISLFDASRDDNRQTFQHEMRIASNGDGPFNWVGGAFYQKNDVQFCVTQVVGFLDFFGLGTPPGYFNNNPLILCNTQDASAIAGFVDGTYDVSEDLHITAGVRYTSEKKTWKGRPRVSFAELDGAPDPFALNELLDASDFTRFPTGVVTNSKTWNKPTYRLNVAYDINDDTMAYGGYTRGFKSGGYNDQLGTQLNPITDLAAQPTEPETADSFEVGIKTSFMEKRGNLSLTAYHVTYNDAQRTFNVSFPSGGQETLFFNAAKMVVKGVEFETSFRLTDELTVRAAGSYMDAKYESFEADTNYDGIIDIDLSGQPVTRAPKWKLAGDVNYLAQLDSGSITLNARLAYEDSTVASYSDVSPEYDATLNAKTVLDASITYDDANDRFFARLIGKNLTDKRYRTGTQSIATLWIMSTYAPPRYLGIELGIKINP
ncbi:MAG: TonB-dependent receptor [Emcibacter sp.]|nr:TonB-dependent receptor [Emcibacter sp.]